MKRIVSIALVIGLVMAVAPFASAQGPAVTGKAGEDRALSLQLSGELDLQMRYGNGAFVFGAQGISADANWLGSPKLNLMLTAALADKASVVAQIAVPRVYDGTLNAFGPETGNGEYWVIAKQLYLKLDQVLTEDLSLTFGIQEVVFDPVGQGNPLMIALGRAELAATAGGDIGTSARDEARAGGLRLDYKLGAVGNIAFVHMLVDDGGSVIANELLTAVDATYKVTDQITVEGLFGLINLAGLEDSEVWLLGIGASTNGAFVEGLNLFAQLGVEFGTVTTDVDAGGLMFDIGANYTLAMDWKPCIGVEYLYVSGDDTTGANAGDDYEGFISYEDNNDLVVLEDKEFGFDIDENYSVVKIRASVQGDLLSSPVKDAFKLEMVLGIAKFNEKVGVPGGTEDALGTELDIKASWIATKQLKVYGGFGMLFGSDVLKAWVDESTVFTAFVGTSVTF